jgi:hypothetical protein
MRAISTDYQYVSNGAVAQIQQGDITVLESGGRALMTEVSHAEFGPGGPNASVQAAWMALLQAYDKVGADAAQGNGTLAINGDGTAVGSALTNIQKIEEAAGLNV